MFSLHDFVMNTICKMVGKEPDYKVQQYALGWYDKAELTVEDMGEIETLISSQYDKLVDEETNEESLEDA